MFLFTKEINGQDLTVNVFATGEEFKEPIEIILLRILKDNGLITQKEYEKTASRLSREEIERKRLAE